MCDPVCEHRFRSCHTVYFILSMDDIGYWTTPSFVEPLALRQLSVAGSAGTLLVPANIRSTRYRKVRRTQITLRHAIVRQSCLTISDMAQDSLNLYFLFGAIFFNRGSDLCLRHHISREYGKQSARASYPKNAGDYPMRIHHPRHFTGAVMMMPAS